MNVRFCWRYEPFSFFSLKDSPGPVCPLCPLSNVTEAAFSCNSFFVSSER